MDELVKNWMIRFKRIKFEFKRVTAKETKE